MIALPPSNGRYALRKFGRSLYGFICTLGVRELLLDPFQQLDAFLIAHPVDRILCELPQLLSSHILINILFSHLNTSPLLIGTVPHNVCFANIKMGRPIFAPVLYSDVITIISCFLSKGKV